MVTPWEVKGEVDYDKLIKEFGTSRINDELVEKISKKAGFMHLFLRRKLFFSHRDLDLILKDFDSGIPFFLYTGRGPSGRTHIGHLVPWIFTKYLQDTFNAKLYFQMTDDEKFLFRDELSLEKTENNSRENALDVIACGFDEKKTKIIYDVENIDFLYRIALKVAKKVTYSTSKAVFGFDNSTNIGLIFFPAVQAAPAFIENERGNDCNCLIPCAIDQDPYWRITRDVAPGLGYRKPGAIHSKFLPGLEGPKGKMSASEESSAIYTTDDEKTVKRKIGSAFTGGQATVEEQKKKGGDSDVCVVFQWLFYLFEEDDKKLEERKRKCKSGELMCGECKKDLNERVWKFLKAHQEKREKAREKLKDFEMK